MSSELVKKALDLNDDALEGTSSLTEKLKGKIDRKHNFKRKEKPRVKSILETYKEIPKVDHLKQNLIYLMNEKKKTNLASVKKLVESYQNQHVDVQYWKEKQKETTVKKRKKLPCVFTDEDFARLSKPQAPVKPINEPKKSNGTNFL